MHEQSYNPYAQLEAMIDSIGTKADKNKTRARLTTLGLTASTALIPVSIVASTEVLPFVLGKLVPSCLAAFAAIVAAWVSIERPHERWGLYRRYHRRLEGDQIRYLQRVEPFDGRDRDDRLAAILDQRQMDLHDEWAVLLPQTAEVAAMGRRTGV